MAEHSPIRGSRTIGTGQDGLPSKFEKDVGDAFNAVQSALFEVQDLVRGVPSLVTSELATIVRSALEDMSAAVQQVGSQAAMQPTPPPPPPPRRDSMVQPLQEQIITLTATNASLLDVKTRLEREVSSLRTDLQKKTRETRKLHEIIIQTGQQEESFDDEEIVKKFGGLYHDILRVVSGHFSTPDPKAKSTMKLHQSFFASDVLLFGLDIEREKAQKELELRMRDRNVPESNITEWRIALIKAAMKMDLKSKHPLGVSDDLLDVLECDHIVPDRKAAQKEMDQLCMDARNIALLLRSSSNTYEWLQNYTIESIPFTDMELTGPFNVRSEAAPLARVRILFGPLYKVVDGERILLRQGDVLNGNS